MYSPGSATLGCIHTSDVLTVVAPALLSHSVVITDRHRREFVREEEIDLLDFGAPADGFSRLTTLRFIPVTGDATGSTWISDNAW